jgi:hypothetical protein
MPTAIRPRILLVCVVLGSGCAHRPAPASGTVASVPAIVATVPAIVATVPGGTALVEHVVKPEQADPAADRWLADQYAYTDRGAASAGKLVVYLIGANGRPAGGRTMMKELAALGFHVIAPMYANDYSMHDLCEPADADDDCHGKARLEAFEGRDHSPHLVVTRANSIEERVAKLLAFLDHAFPGEGWGAFLDGSGPRWPAIIVAGHSHGASSAGLIGKVRQVNRVVMLSGPYDNRARAPAAWTRRPSATPTDRVYALSHANEPQHQGHLADWAAMGLDTLGAITDVDHATPPYGGSHRLVTALPGRNPHGVTAAGGSSPAGPDGRYQLTPAWRYLFGR